MQWVNTSRVIDFLRYRRLFATVSIVGAVGSLLLLFFPGPNYGIDFKGGTEIELAFPQEISSGELRQTVMDLGFQRPDVVRVEEGRNQYILRIQEVSALPEEQVAVIREKLAGHIGEADIEELKVSPGGDKITLRLTDDVEIDAIRQALEVAGTRVRDVERFGQAADHRYEARLVGVADSVVAGLQSRLGDRGPETPLRVEWVGPKAGAQLRDAAVKSLLYAIAFIMVYVAFRFDLRFAPGGVIAMVHDALITIGLFVVLGKEVNLATVAALLTVVGYSINDTIVVYDRIRENMHKMRDTSLYQLINVSTTQTLSRTVITSITTLMSVTAFFIWGTPVIRDIAFALFVGFLVGTYSSIYVAAPFTEWMDRRFFRRAA